MCEFQRDRLAFWVELQNELPATACNFVKFFAFCHMEFCFGESYNPLLCQG